MMKTQLWLSIGGLGAGLASGLAADTDGWINLYNGKNLDGWVQHGGKAKYRAEGAAIVGTTVPKTGNSFLCTTRAFTNFVLELEFKVDPGLNSGVQVRSEVFDKARAAEIGGKTTRCGTCSTHSAGRRHRPARSF